MDIIRTLDTLLTERGEEVERWFAARRKEAAPFIYSSVDLRHSGLKLAPVDTNLFPAGFNNISQAARARAARNIADWLSERGLQGGNVLIVPENHTRNLGYLENLSVLRGLVAQAGAQVEIGSLVAQAGAPIVLTAPGGDVLTEHPLKRVEGFVETESGFRPHVVLLNNDLTAGIPSLLEGLSQLVEPPLSLGWHRRKKSIHFTAYASLAQAFGEAFAIDPWLIGAHFHQCGTVNFGERVGLECVAKGVDKVLAGVREKYAQYGVTDEPYVFIKADSGTYGMGIMTARSGEEVLTINKKTRNKMDVIKEGAHNTEVIIQEGVPTIDSVGGAHAEPMLYLVDGVPVGGAYRVNTTRDALSNLNASGMEFAGMCDELETDRDRVRITGCNFRVFGLIAALASLAAAREDGAAR